MEKKYIQDKDGVQVLPITHISAVRDNGGNTLDSILANDEQALLDESNRAKGAEYTLLNNINTKADKTTTLAGYGITDAYTKSDTYSKTELNNLITTPNQQYVTVTATDQTTAATDVLPATGSADTIYRVGNWDGTQYSEVDYAEYAWDSSAYVLLSTKSQVGEVYDISANHSNQTYTDLTAALGTNGANIPQNLRKGGMSVKFVQSSDNKYVQARCMAQNFTTDVTQWQWVDVTPKYGSKNLTESGGVRKCVDDVLYVGKDISNFQTSTVFGVTYSWDEDGNICHISGETTAESLYKLIDSAASLPDWASVGKTLHFVTKSTSDEIFLRIYLYYGEGDDNRRPYDFKDGGEHFLKIDDDIIGILVTIRTPSTPTTTNYNDYFSVSFLNDTFNNILESETDYIKRVVNPWRRIAKFTERTMNGVSWKWNDEQTICHITNEATGESVFNLIDSKNELPSWASVGKTIHLATKTTNEEIITRIYLYYGSTDSERTAYNFRGNGYHSLEIPAGTIGILVTIRTPSTASGTDYNDDYSIEFVSTPLDNIMDENFNKNIASVQSDISTIELSNTFPNNWKSIANFANRSHKGLTWIWNDLHTKCHISGTSTGESIFNLIDSQASLPNWTSVGSTAHFVIKTTNANIFARVYLYFGSGDSNRKSYDFKGSGAYSLNIPAGCIGMLVTLRTPSSAATYDDDFEIEFLTEPSNGELYNRLLNVNTIISRWKEDVDFSVKINLGVTYTWNNDHTKIYVTGTSTGESRTNLIDTAKMLPTWMVPGGVLYFATNTTNSDIFTRIYFYDEDGNSTSFNLKGNGVHKVTVPLDAVGTLFTVRQSTKSAGITFDDVYFIECITESLYNIIAGTSGSVKPVSLKVCSFNVGMFNYGYDNTELHPRINVPEKVELVKKFIAENNFDIICCQECSNSLSYGEGQTIGVNSEVFEKAFLGTFLTGNAIQKIASKYTLLNQRKGEFVAKYNDNTRYWMLSDINLDGKTVAIFNCHLAYQVEATEVRALQMEEVIEMLKNYDNAILFGDWNVQSIDEFNTFADAGYYVVNGAYLDAVKTHPALPPQLHYYDNVIIKGNARGFCRVADIGHVPFPSGTYNEEDYYVSDHMPLVAEIVL